METKTKPRAIFMAFGTKGDVFPIAAIVAAFAVDQRNYNVFLITHSAHQSLEVHLAEKGASFIPISTPPVLSVHQVSNGSDSEVQCFSSLKKTIKMRHRQECLDAVEIAFGDALSTPSDFIAINFFALEGWSLAELYQVQCIVAAPYVVPYSASSSFERQFKYEFPDLYEYFQEAPDDKVNWKDVLHWLWPLFLEDWGSWRQDCLNLSPVPFTDPVTDLPLWHIRAQSPLLLYGFSKEIVECPGYWPSNIHACGFWFMPMNEQFSCHTCRDAFSLHSYEDSVQRIPVCTDHIALQQFLENNSSPYLPIFIGLSSIGSMGFLQSPRAFISVLKAVLDKSNYKFLLFSAGYEPLDAAIQSAAGSSPKSNTYNNSSVSKNGTLLFSDRLFCFSGTMPYSWLFPRCSVVIHHGGSGSTAAALRAGIPQIVCPFILDQFYWAERLYWLGVAPEPLNKEHLLPDNLDDEYITKAATALSSAIKRAMTSEMKNQASRVSRKIYSEDGIGEALKVIEEKVIHRI